MSDPRPAPYPADTRAKGWRFELDLEQVMQSDTWALAAEVPMAQHALLMMWTVSWMQTPCGAMPADPELVRAKLRIPPKFWPAMREIVLRGWWLAEDSRLYHDTIVARVQEMLGRKSAERTRKAEYRARTAAASEGSPATVPPMSHGTDAGKTLESDTGTGTSTSSQDKPVKKRAAAAAALPCPDGVSDQTWADWLALRARKRAPVTPTVLNGAVSEAGKAGMTLEAFLQIWCQRGSQGLQADWLRPAERAQAPPAKTFRERDQDLAAARVHEMTGGLVSARPPKPIAIEEHHGFAIRVD